MTWLYESPLRMDKDSDLEKVWMRKTSGGLVQPSVHPHLKILFLKLNEQLSQTNVGDNTQKQQEHSNPGVDNYLGLRAKEF